MIKDDVKALTARVEALEKFITLQNQVNQYLVNLLKEEVEVTGDEKRDIILAMPPQLVGFGQPS